MKLWPRFAVKVAVSVGRELHGDAWLGSDHGLLLNRLLWGREKQIAMRPLPTKRPFSAGSGWTPPPDHVIMTLHDKNPMVLITLFGEDCYAVPLVEPPPPAGAPRGFCTRTSARRSK
jgi:hypothetical protein